MESQTRKKKKLLSFVCYAVILIGLLSAVNLYQRLEDEQRDHERYLDISEETVYWGLSGIYWTNLRMDSFFFGDNCRYKLYAGDYGAEVVFTNCHDLYSLYSDADNIYQYLAFDMGLKDPDHAQLYQQAAQPFQQLKDVIVANPSEEDFKAHSDDIAAAIERIEPLQEIWKEESGGLENDVSIALMRTICERFVSE